MTRPNHHPSRLIPVIIALGLVVIWLLMSF